MINVAGHLKSHSSVTCPETVIIAGDPGLEIYPVTASLQPLTRDR